MRTFPPAVEAIFLATEYNYGLTRAEITGPSREPLRVQARGQIARKLRSRGMVLAQIARYLGRKSHSTILDYLT